MRVFVVFVAVYVCGLFVVLLLFNVIGAAEASGARILVDGRPWTARSDKVQPCVCVCLSFCLHLCLSFWLISSFSFIVCQGFWIGPTILVHNNEADRALHEEIFGPVLSVLEVDSKEKAVEIENRSPYGNAAWYVVLCVVFLVGVCLFFLFIL